MPRRSVSLLELFLAPGERRLEAVARLDLVELAPDLGRRRIERRKDVEAGIERIAKAGRIEAAVDRKLGSRKRLGRDQGKPPRVFHGCGGQLLRRHDAVDHADLERPPGVDAVAEIDELTGALVAD